jgi:hypothetical protein
MLNYYLGKARHADYERDARRLRLARRAHEARREQSGPGTMSRFYRQMRHWFRRQFAITQSFSGKPPARSGCEQ